MKSCSCRTLDSTALSAQSLLTSYRGVPILASGPGVGKMTTGNDQEFSKKAIQNIMDIFVTPEVKRRQDAGPLPKPVKLSLAQVILLPHERRPLVRINDEVRAKAKVKYKPGISKKPGDPIYENEIDRIENVELGPDDDPDCGHIFLHFYGTTASVFLDFRRNRALAQKHIQRAKDFLKTASQSWQSGNLAPCIDNLFNSAELSAKAVLLVMYDYPQSLRARSSHRAIHIRFNRFANLGNVMPKHKETYNKLARLRDPARYLKKNLPKLNDADITRMLNAVKR